MPPLNLMLLTSFLSLFLLCTPAPIPTTPTSTNKAIVNATIFTILQFPSMPPPKGERDVNHELGGGTVSAAIYTILPYPSMPPLKRSEASEKPSVSTFLISVAKAPSPPPPKAPKSELNVKVREGRNVGSEKRGGEKRDTEEGLKGDDDGNERVDTCLVGSTSGNTVGFGNLLGCWRKASLVSLIVGSTVVGFVVGMW